MTTHEQEYDERTLNLIGGGSTVMNVIMFGAIGVIALESTTYGALMGLFGGVGTYLFLPWMLRLSSVQNGSDEDVPFSEVLERTGGNPRMGAFGLGLEIGAIAMFAAGMALDGADPHIGLGAGLAATLAVLFVATLVFNLLRNEPF
ncbi:hypothetical protein [Natronolimnohabitans innermongolicus]|uniref:Uncharacterized protein n=1 Tax=Natronolimnohabitans innermongolicus JCM 12255 TaxID=1227499 RepID=L9X1H1_9EURY|nr:hypothetical protein [Natronolimnohabitans innermongolicus]ELY55560.1 hypothetical protein C493_11372 [Natronolimnohabitans innermongolicus JCM 12255]